MERLRKPRDTTAKLAPTRRRVALAAVLALLTLGWPDLASPARARSVGGNAVRQQVDVSGHAALRVTAKAKRCAATLTVSVGGRRAASGRVTRHRRTLTAARLLGPGRHTVELRGRRGCALDVTRVTARAVWVPAPGTSWQWQLSGPLDPSVEAAMYDLDLFDTPASTVAALHAQGRRVVCYLSAGSVERGRADAGAFGAGVAGQVLDGWPDERWLDIRRLDRLRRPLERRLDQCARKGFDAVEADNVDAYANDSGFDLTATDQLRFNRFLAAAAHARGLSIGLKNDLDQVAALEPDFDWALNEECFRYKECARLRPFVAAGKAVFVAEYALDTSAFCAQANAEGFVAMRKRLALDAWRAPCW